MAAILVNGSNPHAQQQSLGMDTVPMHSCNPCGWMQSPCRASVLSPHAELCGCPGLVQGVIRGWAVEGQPHTYLSKQPGTTLPGAVAQGPLCLALSRLWPAAM